MRLLDANRRTFIIISTGALVALLVVGIVLTRKARAAVSVQLSNGQTVWLGQSEKSLLDAMGDQVVERREAPGVYRYPSNTAKAAQANISVENGRVVTIIFGNSSENYHVGSKLRVGSPVQEVRSRLGNKLIPIDSQVGPVKRDGYVVAGRNEATYYVTEYCGKDSGKMLIQVALAVKGHESKLTHLTRPLECLADSDQQKSSS